MHLKRNAKFFSLLSSKLVIVLNSHSPQDPGLSFLASPEKKAALYKLQAYMFIYPGMKHKSIVYNLISQVISGLRHRPFGVWGGQVKSVKK